MMKYFKKIFLSCISLPVVFSILAAESGLRLIDNADIFKQRRDQVLMHMGEGIAFFPGMIRNEYGQSDEGQAKYLYYLTGIRKARAICALDADSKRPFQLIIPPSNPMHAFWSGLPMDASIARKRFGAEVVHPAGDYKKIFRRLIRGKKKIYLNINNRWLMKQLSPLLNGRQSIQLVNIKPFLDEMRVIKDPVEIGILRRAINITSDALNEVYRFIQPGVWEYQVEGVIEYMFRAGGAQKPAFPSITGSGVRATILHYEDNNQLVRDGDLVLMDVGAELDGYAADISRTVPANGRFSPEQRQIYSIVLKAQKAAIRQMQPGKGIAEAHHTATDIIVKGLFKLGLIFDVNSKWQRDIFVLYPNSHYLGLDVHDVGDYGMRKRSGRSLKAGMVLTIEPGIYFHPQLLNTLHHRFGKRVDKDDIARYISKVKPVFEKYIGIGVRIEDDVLITATGNEVLSKRVPKEIAAIEGAMRGKSRFNLSN